MSSEDEFKANNRETLSNSYVVEILCALDGVKNVTDRQGNSRSKIIYLLEVHICLLKIAIFVSGSCVISCRAQ